MIIDRISAVRGDLRPSERKVADLILQRPLLACDLAIAETAAQADVSEPTVMRFCRTLGLSGYAELRRQLVRDLARRAPPVHRPHDAPLQDALADGAALLAQTDTLRLVCAMADLAAALTTDLTAAGFQLSANAALRLHITESAILLAHADGRLVAIPAPTGAALMRRAATAHALATLIARAAPADADAVQSAREAAHAAAQRAFRANRVVPS